MEARRIGIGQGKAGHLRGESSERAELRVVNWSRAVHRADAGLCCFGPSRRPAGLRLAHVGIQPKRLWRTGPTVRGERQRFSELLRAAVILVRQNPVIVRSPPRDPLPIALTPRPCPRTPLLGGQTSHSDLFDKLAGILAFWTIKSSSETRHHWCGCGGSSGTKWISPGRDQRGSIPPGRSIGGFNKLQEQTLH